MSIIKAQNIGLLLDEPQTYSISDSSAGSTTLSVKNLTGFTTNQILMLGFLGGQGTEIVKTHASTPPSGSTITLASATIFSHSASTTITAMAYDQVEFSNAATSAGSKTVFATTNISANSDFTIYNDTTNSSGYYFARFKNSILLSFSAYSDPIPVSGYTQQSARSVINSALGMINKSTNVTLTDSYAFQEIDNCQMETLRQMKRWSWMQKFDQNVGTLTTGQWRVALPTDCDDQNTNKSIYNFKIGKGTNIAWVDKEKWNYLTQGICHTTLLLNISLGNTTVTLTDSSNFDDTGTLAIGGNTYSYTANSRSTGILTISAATTINTAGQDVFQGAATGEPLYWTTFGGYIYFYPTLGPTYNNRTAYLDYYSSIIRTVTDTQTLVVPDPTTVQYYLAWKFMLRMNNGEDTEGSDSKYKLYITGREEMKKKESMNRTFQLKPLQNKFTMANGDPRSIRLGNFSVNA